MKSREAAMRLKRFEADEKARNVAELEEMIRQFEAMATDLDRQIKAEEARTGVKDPAHFAYSTFAKSASQRRDNLQASVAGLRDKLAAAITERDEAFEQITKAAGTPERAVAGGARRGERSPGMALP